MTDADITPEIRARLKAMEPRIKSMADALAHGLNPKAPAPLERVARMLAEVVVAIQDGPIERIASMESRLDALEAGGIKYCGTFQRALPYRRGDTVTHDGSLWIALRNTTEGEQPGRSPATWQLAQKSRQRVPAKRGKSI